VRVDAVEWAARVPATAALADFQHGMGRELFAGFRAHASGAEEGAVTFYAAEPEPPIPASPSAPLHDRFVFATGPDGAEDPAVPSPPAARS
jgi:phosphogluconate dehydratase